MAETPYVSGFTGIEIDEAIRKVYNHDLSMIGFVELKSSPMNPVNLDLVNEPGNYYIRHFINGHTEMQAFSPINLNVTYRNDTLIQTVTVADAVFKREQLLRVFETGEFKEMGPWKMTTAGTAISVDSNPVPEIGPQPPAGESRLGTLWVDTSDSNTAVLRFWNGTDWEGVSFINYEANTPGVAMGSNPPTDGVRPGTLWIDNSNPSDAVLKYTPDGVNWLPVTVGSGDVTVTTRQAVEIGPTKPTENLVEGLLWINTADSNVVVMEYYDGTDFQPLNIDATSVKVSGLY